MTHTPGDYYQRDFPIGEGKTDYEKYLRTLELLSLQKPKDQLASPEEWLFQVTHQTAELWMKLAVYELDRILAWMNADELAMASRGFRLVLHIQHLLTQQVDLLAQSISIVEYGKIRTALGQGSGMESPGFNTLLKYPPKLWAAFQGVLQRKGITIREIYEQYQTHIHLHTLAENLMDFDDAFHKWRTHHFDLVSRTIGAESNSLKGISSMVLQRGVLERCFPELLAIRNTLTNESGLAYGGQPLATS